MQKGYRAFILCCFCAFAVYSAAFAQVEIKKSEKTEVQNGQKYYIHTAEKGQTLFSISRVYRVPLNEIIADNPQLSSGLKVGQILKIKSNDGAAAESAPVTVSPPTNTQPQIPPPAEIILKKEEAVAEIKPAASPASEAPLNVESMKFSKEYFDNLETALQHPAEVGYLDLAMHNLGTFPSKITGFMNLKCLDLSYNNLTELPAPVAELVNLQYLDLTGNKLSIIPDYIKKLVNLKQLILKETNLSNAEIQKVKKLLPGCTIIVS